MQAFIIPILDHPGLNRPAVSPMTEKGGRTIFSASPVGTFPGIPRIVRRRAGEGGARISGGVAVGETASV